MKKNKNLKLNGSMWCGVFVIIVAAAALVTNIGGIRGARFRSAVANSVTNSPGAQAMITPPTATTETTGLPTTALALQEGISHAVSMVRSAVVSISGATPPGQVTAPYGLSYIRPYTSNVGPIGSGIIVDSRGYILTTFQTVGKAREVEVTLFSAGRQKYQAEVIATDPGTDLVLLKVRSFDSFPAAIMGNSDSLEVGDLVFAVGSPFGFSKTVTMGIISTHRRQLTIDGVRYPDMIQTDAAINDGDAGGPLINIKGEVVGINVAYFVPGNHFTGIGFALPVNNAMPLLTAIQ